VDWYLHLSSHPLNAVRLLDGDPAQVAVWTSWQHIHFYTQHNGIFWGSLHVFPPAEADFQSEGWRSFVETLRAPNGAYLPVVDTGQTVVYTANDGRLRLYRGLDHRLALDMDGQVVILDRDGAAPIVALGFDRELGTVGALDADRILHIYQQHVYVGAYFLTEDLNTDTAVVLLPEASGIILVADTHSIGVLDMAGQAQHTATLPFMLGTVACSPDGSQIVVSDAASDMLHVYDAHLNLARQGDAFSLVRQTTQLQLLATLPSPGTPSQALDITDEGTLALALDGILCLTHVAELPFLPQPRTLF
jgi:hypothetical protein